MPQTKEERLEKRRKAYENETPIQREQRKRHAKESYQRHRERRSLKAAERRKQGDNAEKAYLHKQEYYRKFPNKYLLMLAKRRAKTEGVEFNIDENDFKVPEFCPILNIKLSPVFSSFSDRDVTPSLDRVDNSKGYIKGNIKVISFKANRNKGDMSTEDIERLYNYIRSETH